MKSSRYYVCSLAFIALSVGIGIGVTVAPASGQGEIVYELRSYYVHEGRADALHARFRDHTMAIFDKHGMKNIGYWVPAEPKADDPALVYLIAHASREQADANWKAFATDPEWQAVQKASEADGKIVSKVERMYLNPTDYSPLK